jgi:photosystem II stability/assembly factor-like uncharacterized protein
VTTRVAFPVLFLCAALALAAEDKRPPRVEEDEKETRGEADAIRDRVRLYLERHGEHGRIDPEKRLKAVAREYARHRAERLQLRTSSTGPADGTWVSIGPTNGAGRMTAIRPHPATAGTYYAGAAGGGVWKTTDSGATWTPLTDGIHDLSVGALAIAPSSPNILYVGSGEGGYAFDFVPGIGLLTSTDGGETWSFPQSVVATTFYRISVHPTNPLDLVVGTNQGGLRTTDGGGTWSSVIPRDIYGDVTEVVRDLSNPDVVYAATWCVANCSVRVARILKSTDSGSTWSDKSTGLPTADPPPTPTFRFNERLSLAISPSNPQILYAATALASDVGGSRSHVYKTTDGGETWTDLTSVANNANAQVRGFLGAQSWYDNAIVVSPTDPNVVIAGGVTYIRSLDGGTTFARTPMTGVHVDVHDLHYVGSTLLIANDGGIWTSPDDGRTATPHNLGLVTRQYYALASDPANRNRILAGSQDNGTDQRQDGGGTTWRPVIGGDGFQCAINPLSPSVAYGTFQNGLLFRSKSAGSDQNPNFTFITPPYEGDEPTPFFSLVRMDPSNPGTIYTGSFRLWKSDNGGDFWRALSSTVDGVSWPSSTVTAIAIAPSAADTLMVAKSNAVFRSTDGGRSWVRSASPGSAPVNDLEIDPVNPLVAYAALGTTSGDSIYRTTDGGVTWIPRSNGLPEFAAQAVRVDPGDPNVLYCGTDVGVFRSENQGGSWSRFGTGLPSASVYDVNVLADGSLLRVATHGRGVWELTAGSGNTVPTAAILQPAASLSVARGESVTFVGTVADADAGDPVTGTWMFPDTWETVEANGASTISHAFTHPGVFPVGLTARDARGALASATTTVTVREPWDACAAPYHLPAAGPFPYTILTDNEAASQESGDPQPACVPNRGASLWLDFTPEQGGEYEFSTCGGPSDTVLSVWSGAACGPYTPLAEACNDDAPSESICGGTLSSVVRVTAAAGETLRVLVTPFSFGDSGRIPVTVRLVNGTELAPRVTGISRIVGPSSGGTSLYLSGAGFAAAAAVEFGGEPATVLGVEPNLIELTTPAHPGGPVDVVVRNSDGGSGTMAGAFTYLASAPIAPCAPGPQTLCLNGGRFQVAVVWRAPSLGTSGAGQAVVLTGDTGYFWFFNNANVELIVKVLDGRPLNQRFWVFYGALSDVEYTITVTDTATGAIRTYFNPPGRLASVADTSAFAGVASATGEVAAAGVAAPRSARIPDATRACSPGSTALCLNQGRFQVRVDWNAPSLGTSGSGQAVPLSGDTGYFWFFSSGNVELVVKVLDGLGVNGKFWVFFGALSDVEYTVTVTDTVTGRVRTYVNPAGRLASVADTSAF